MVVFAGNDERLAIRDVVETWANARDSGDWEAFRDCWHQDGYMMATWFQGPKEDFIRVSQEGWANGVSILHFTGGCRITLGGDSLRAGSGSAGQGSADSGSADSGSVVRAIAQTRMTIMQRAEVHGVVCDAACTGRFYDFFEKRGDRWGIVLRQPIYERDRLDPVDPAASLRLDPELLASFPEGYRHLAYLQTQAGYAVKPDMPGLRGPEVAALYERGAAWLRGELSAGGPNRAAIASRTLRAEAARRELQEIPARLRWRARIPVFAFGLTVATGISNFDFHVFERLCRYRTP
jgi:SnoaL-like domain